ncbi:Gypsy retrotransposon integrase-like protein 1 [Vitis vinifera]|uniref:Gypsy retrotransposon integrase-like protein 1 n=1 Tax=Vitis vinifera TaxID=29760 RepID=A0A438GG60_VITVI|nr:Gypsy retrotransposon integrase-like protein 1 [Vitis vinifera]
MSFDQHSSTVVLDIMRSMSYLPGMGLGRRQHGPSEFITIPDHDVPFGLGFIPTQVDYRYMARLRKERVRARLTYTLFDYPLRPYTRSLSDYFLRASESLTRSDVIIGGLSTSQEADLQLLVRQLRLRDGAPGPSTSALIAPSSPDRKSLMTLCFPDEIDDHGIFAEVGDIVDGAAPHDEYIDEMLALSLSQIEETVQLRLASSFDIFGVSAIELADESLTAPAPKPAEDVIAFDDWIDSPVGLVEGVTFEYLPVSRDIILSAPSSPTSQIFDIDGKIAQHDSDDDSSSASDSDPINQRVSPAVGDTKIVDFGTTDQPRELRIGLDLSTDERDSLIQLLRSYLDVFAWSYEDMPGLDPSIVKEEIQKQLSVGFLSVVEYPEWLANVVPVPKKDGKRNGEDIFITEWGTYCYRVMPFELKNAGATYQRAATTLFHDMMHRDVEVYVDVIVKSRVRSDHLAALERFFERIRQFRLRLKPKKCTFGVTSRKLLGAIDDDFPDEDVAAVTSMSGWRMYFDGAANHSGYGIGVLLIPPHDDHIPKSVRLAFSDRHPTTNNIIQGEWKTRDAKLRPYHAYLELLVARFKDLRYTHLPRARNQFADALATLASMIDIPVDATVRPLLIESRYAPAYFCLIDDVEPDDGLPWYHDIYHFLRLGVRSLDRMLLLCLDPASADRVMREVHAGVCGPHMGGHMLARKIMRTGYFWLTMETDCCQFVQRCLECQIHGDLIHVPPSELHALTSPWPFSVWGIDIIGKISPKSSSGHEFILVAIDYFTKWVEAASYARLTSDGVASFIRSHIICRYGVPHELISDRGVPFRAEVDALVQRHGIRHHRSSAYRPQTNEAVEAVNKNIKRILQKMVETSRDWSEKLPFALWAYRTSFRTSTGATPY